MLELTPGPSSSRSCRKLENRRNSTEGQGWRNVGWQHLPRPLTSSRRSSGEKKCSAASRACPARKSRTRVDCARISRILAICPILNPRCHYGSVLDVVGGLPTIQCQDISCFSLRLPRFGEIGRSLAKN